MTFHADEYKAAAGRYRAGMPYRRAGRSGLDLPAISLGLWHNFGDDVPLERQQATLRRAFDLGVTHFDLANNYGPPYGSAERNFGTHLRAGLPALPRRADHLDQGRLRHVAGPVRPGRRLAQVPARLARPVAAADGPGLRRHLLQPPVRRDDAARGDDGRARLAGPRRARRSTSASPRTPATRTREAVEILRAMGTPLLIHQPSYSMLNRWIEEDLLDAARRDRARLIAFSPLAQGMLTDKYLEGIPDGLPRGAGQVARPVAAHRGLAQARPRARPDRQGARPVARPDGPGLGAARRARHLGAHRRLVASSSSSNSLDAVKNLKFTAEELAKIDRHAVDAGINLWKTSSDS